MNVSEHSSMVLRHSAGFHARMILSVQSRIETSQSYLRKLEVK